MAHEVHDHYFRQAKRDGYRSRAAYKLIEIDDRKKVLRRGDRVLDCGAAPGSWVQIAAQRIGPRGFVVGIDLKRVAALPDPNVALIEGDLREITREAIRAAAGLPDDGAFDVILSDMAPYTSGEHLRDHHRSVRLCEAVLDRVPDLLKPGGHVVMKVFEGTAYPDLLARLRRMFRTVKGFKPKASRDTSTEIYVIAHGFRGRDTTAPTEDAAPERALPPRKPSTGWS